jgi:uncharacterized membrane protein YphA (DoxX/SURF4 family)
LPIFRSSPFWVLTTLLLLRVIIGWHFFTEGTTKLKSGDFSAEPFFRAAHGPLASVVLRLVPDAEGRLRLGLVETPGRNERPTYALDSLVTEELWRGFAYRAAKHYGFGDSDFSQELSERIESLRKKQAQQTAALNSAANAAMVQATISAAEATRAAVAKQKEQALAVVDRYLAEYRDLLTTNESEILAYFRGAERLVGFDRDGPRRAAVVDGVASLGDQKSRIAGDRQRDVRQWLAEVDQMWDGVEADVNALATPEQRARGSLAIDRPHRDPWSALTWIDRIVPWFDAIVGGCLILGLLTRWASLAGALFLATIISLQPPWFAGSVSTMPQAVELAALLVIWAAGSAWYIGLDVFLARRNRAAMTAERGTA